MNFGAMLAGPGGSEILAMLRPCEAAAALGSSRSLWEAAWDAREDLWLYWRREYASDPRRVTRVSEHFQTEQKLAIVEVRARMALGWRHRATPWSDLSAYDRGRVKRIHRRRDDLQFDLARTAHRIARIESAAGALLRIQDRELQLGLETA